MVRTKSCLLVLAVIACLLNTSLPPANAVVQRPPLKSESQIRSEASLYDAAIREISRIETMKITTVDDLIPIKAILQRHLRNIKFSRSKLISLGLQETSFINAAKARTSDSKKAEEFARELATDDQSIYKLTGAQTLKDKIKRSAESDAAMLRRVADYVSRLSAQIKEKPAHHALSSTVAKADPQREAVVNVIAAVVVTSVIVSVVIIACPPLALAIPYLVATAAGTAIYVGLLALVANATENAGTEEGRNKAAECSARAERVFDNCVATTPMILLPKCLLNWTAETVKCNLLE